MVKTMTEYLMVSGTNTGSKPYRMKIENGVIACSFPNGVSIIKGNITINIFPSSGVQIKRAGEDPKENG
jgi:aspartate carbamoyltransferase regulatory subunit